VGAIKIVETQKNWGALPPNAPPWPSRAIYPVFRKTLLLKRHNRLSHGITRKRNKEIVRLVAICGVPRENAKAFFYSVDAQITTTTALINDITADEVYTSHYL